MYGSQLEAHIIGLRILENYVLIPLSPQAKMKNESDRARFLYIGTWHQLVEWECA